FGEPEDFRRAREGAREAAHADAHPALREPECHRRARPHLLRHQAARGGHRRGRASPSHPAGRRLVRAALRRVDERERRRGGGPAVPKIRVIKHRAQSRSNGADTMTQARQMRLGLSMRYLGYHIAAWRHPDVPADGAVSYDYFLNTALKAEAAKF